MDYLSLCESVVIANNMMLILFRSNIQILERDNNIINSYLLSLMGKFAIK